MPSGILLSGLLECGTCGGTYAVVVGDRYGRAAHHRSRTSTNNRTIRREELERRALAGIAERMVSADKVEAAVAAYAKHINRENREQRIQGGADRQALAKVDKAIAGIMAAIEQGLYQPSMKARMAEIYKRKVARLTETLGDPKTRLDASSDIRSLVSKIVLRPSEKRSEVRATLRGSLIGILDFVNNSPRQQPSIT